jgi:hypothetical protein
MEMRTTVLHTEEAAEAILMVLVIMETLEAWAKEWVIKTAEAQAEAEEQAATGNMEQQAVAVAHLTQDKMVRIQHKQTELVVLDMLEDLVLDQEHLVVE